MALSCGGSAKCEEKSIHEGETHLPHEATYVYQTLHNSSTSALSDYERDFFESWEALAIISMAAFLISCVFVLWIFTRTRLRYTTCCMPVMDSCTHESDSDSLCKIDLETGKIEGISWTLDELKDLDYFDTLSDTESLGIISLESFKRHSADTTQSISSNRSRKTSASSLQNFSCGLFKEHSDEDREISANDLSRSLSGDSGMCQLTESSRNLRSQSDGNQRSEQINISRKLSGGSLRRLSGNSLGNEQASHCEDISRRPSGDSGLVIFSRRSSRDSSKRPSGDSTGSGVVYILRKSSGDSLRRPPGDSTGSAVPCISRKSSGNSLRKHSGDSTRNGVESVLRKSSGDSIRRVSADSAGSGVASILRKSSGDSIRRGSGDSIRRGSGDSIRRGSGDSIRRGSGDSIRRGSGDSIRRGSMDSLGTDSISILKKLSEESLGSHSSDILDLCKNAGENTKSLASTSKTFVGDSTQNNEPPNAKNPSQRERYKFMKKFLSFGKKKKSTGDSVTILVGDNLRKYYEKSSIENLHELNYRLIPKRRVSLGNLKTGQPLEAIIETHTDSPRDSLRSSPPKKTKRLVRFDSEERESLCDSDRSIYRSEDSENTTVK